MADYINRDMDGYIVPQRQSDGYVNATACAKIHLAKTGERRDPADWLKNKRTKESIAHLSSVTGILVTDLVEVIQGGSSKNQGTYIHPSLAVRYGIWLSDDFGYAIEQWVQSWATGKNPKSKKVLEPDRPRLRIEVKDEARLAVTDQIMNYLIEIGKYDDKKYSGAYFAHVHDQINVAITGETAKQMLKRLEKFLGRRVAPNALIRDYFPAVILQRYISMCYVISNLMISQGVHPDKVVAQAANLALPPNYAAKPIDFERHYMSEII